MGIRCPSYILRELRIATFLQLLNIELERGLRLLLRSSGHYWSEEDQAALSGVLGRIGQMYQELQQRRRGKNRALTTLLVELAKLPGGRSDAPTTGLPLVAPPSRYCQRIELVAQDVGAPA